MTPITEAQDAFRRIVREEIDAAIAAVLAAFLRTGYMPGFNTLDGRDAFVDEVAIERARQGGKVGPRWQPPTTRPT